MLLMIAQIGFGLLALVMIYLIVRVFSPPPQDVLGERLPMTDERRRLIIEYEAQDYNRKNTF